MTAVESDGLLLHALADQELDAATALSVERRIAADPDLAAEYARIVALKDVVAGLPRPVVSRSFHDSIAALARLSEDPQPRHWYEHLRAPREWQKLAASIVVTACLASGLTYSLMAPRLDTSIEEAVANGHRRSLLAASPVDIASSDRHTVRPWLDSKLGFSPPTPDLAASGYPLVGGRVDVLAGRAVPTLVYKHAQHLITVIAIPVDAREPPQSPVFSATDGYNMVHWSRGAFRYWAVSDLDAGDLKAFVEDLRAH